jgi:histidine triad (HIT) family protein
MAETIFSKILSGDIPSYKVYEDDLVYAFLDIGPLSPGHTLIIPKEAAPTLDTLSDESSAAIGRILPRLCRAVMAATGTKEYNVLQNNGTRAHQAVMHVHYHIIPKPDAERGLGVGWPSTTLEQNDAQALAKAITEAI